MTESRTEHKTPQKKGIWYLLRRHGRGPWMPFTQLRQIIPQEGYEMIGPFESYESALKTLHDLGQATQ